MRLPVRSSEEADSWLVHDGRWVPSLGKCMVAGKPQQVWQWRGSEEGGQTLLSR